MTTCKTFLLPAVAFLCCGVAAAAVSDAAKSACEAAREYGAAVRNCDMVWALDSLYPPMRRLLAAQLAARDPKEAKEAQRILMGVDYRVRGRDVQLQEVTETPQQRAERERRYDKLLRDQYAGMGAAMKKGGMQVERYSVGTPTAEYVLTPAGSLAANAKKDSRGNVNAEDITGGRDRSRLIIIPTVLVVSTAGPNGTKRRVERRSFIYAVRDEVAGNAPVRKPRWYFMDANTKLSVLRSFFVNLPAEGLKLPPVSDRELR